MKKKFKIELSEQVKKTIDEMLASGDKEGFQELTSLINKIAENPHCGNRFIGEKNDIFLDRLNALAGLPLNGLNIECEDPHIIFLLVGDKELGLLDAERSGTLRPGDKTKNYKFEKASYDSHKDGYLLQFKTARGKEIIIHARSVCLL